MCRTRSKKVYSQFKYIAFDRCKTVYKQILSHCRCTAQERLKHGHRTHSRVCIKYGTKEFTHNFQELVSQDLKQWLRPSFIVVLNMDSAQSSTLSLEAWTHKDTQSHDPISPTHDPLWSGRHLIRGPSPFIKETQWYASSVYNDENNENKNTTWGATEGCEWVSNPSYNEWDVVKWVFMLHAIVLSKVQF
jgi:hypothetical protein